MLCWENWEPQARILPPTCPTMKEVSTLALPPIPQVQLIAGGGVLSAFHFQQLRPRARSQCFPASAKTWCVDWPRGASCLPQCRFHLHGEMGARTRTPLSHQTVVYAWGIHKGKLKWIDLWNIIMCSTWKKYIVTALLKCWNTNLETCEENNEKWKCRTVIIQIRFSL